LRLGFRKHAAPILDEVCRAEQGDGAGVNGERGLEDVIGKDVAGAGGMLIADGGEAHHFGNAGLLGGGYLGAEVHASRRKEVGVHHWRVGSSSRRPRSR